MQPVDTGTGSPLQGTHVTRLIPAIEMKDLVARIDALLRQAPPPNDYPLFGGRLRPDQVSYVMDLALARKRQTETFYQRLAGEVEMLHRLWKESEKARVSECLTTTQFALLNRYFFRDARVLGLLRDSKGYAGPR